MKPVLWIPLLALIGGLLGYFLFRTTGWFSTGIGVVVGVLLGTMIYSLKTNRK